MKGNPPAINPALSRLKPDQWKDVLKDAEAYAEDLRSEGLDAQVVHPMFLRYAEYENHHGPGFMLSRERWEEIVGRIKSEKLGRYEVLVTPKGWMRVMMVTLYSDDEKLAFVLPLLVEERQLQQMKSEASADQEMWLHLYNVRREYMSLPLLGALDGLGHEDDSQPESETGGQAPPDVGQPTPSD